MEEVKQNLIGKFEPKQVDKSKTKTVAKDNQLVRSPKQDEFQSISKQTEPAEKSILGLTKKEILIAGGSIATTAAVLGSVILKKGRNFDEAIRILERQNDNLEKLSKEATAKLTQEQAAVATKLEKALAEQKANFDTEITKIKEGISGLMDVPENAQKYQENMVEVYKKQVDKVKLEYDPLKPPIEKAVLEKPYWAKTFAPLTEVPTPSVVKLENLLEVDKLTAQLKSTGKIEFEIPKVNYKGVESSKEAYIGNKQIEGLGKTLDTDFKVDYGKRTDWSDEKIARDIMQNFYDGHGNTLEGVKVAVEKIGDKFKIKISGDAMFEHENLRYLGSGNKLENPYNAGGFGEGSRIVVANLLGKGDASSVKFASADWELLFNGSNGIMQRTLNKSSKPVQGNFIEFETANENLVNSVLKSTKYFESPSNPDFKGLTFENKSFGFRFLPEGEKGNIYLTQRFEFGQQGQWENGVENLNLIFKRKPDAEKYEKLIGEKFSVGRDRAFLANDDIEKLTKYFSQEMSDKELMDSIMSTKDMWTKFEQGKPNTLASFLKSLTAEARNRHIAIDFGKERYAYVSKYANKTVMETLTSYKYKLCHMLFESVGVPSAVDVFSSLSHHVPIAPTSSQIQKMKLLEEATMSIQEGLEQTFNKKIKKIAQNINVKTNLGKGDDPLFMYSLCKDPAIVKFTNELEIKYDKQYVWNPLNLYKNMDEAEWAKCKELISSILNSKIKNLSTDLTSEEAKTTIKIMRELGNDKCIDEYTKRQLKTLDNLDIITKEDVTKPRFIFNRKNELASNTLGEAMIDNKNYVGHWIDGEYLDKTNFSELLATWLHEICHKHGGDGTAEFTYKLTDLIDGILNSTAKNKQIGVKLNAIEEVFDGIK